MEERAESERRAPNGDGCRPTDGMPQIAPPIDISAQDELSAVRLRSIARVFKIFGWFWVVVYTPVVITCVGSLLVTLAGYRIDSPLVLAGASVFNGGILALAMLYVRTGRRITLRDMTARRRALVLSSIMMLGFPILTVVGAICYRDIRRYLKDDALAVAA